MLSSTVAAGRRGGIAILVQGGGGGGPQGPDPAQSTISVVGGGSSVVSGASKTLRLQAKTAAGVNVTSGGLTIVPTKTGGTATGTLSSVTDNGDGTYDWTYTGILAGTAQTLGATMSSVAVSSSLPTLSVTPGAIDRTTSTVTIAASSAAQGGSAVTATLHGKDAAGNLRTSGGGTIVGGHSGGTSVVTDGAVTDVGDGTYTWPLTPVTEGTATTLSATINGQAVTTTMPTFTVTSAYVAPDILVNVSFETSFDGMCYQDFTPPNNCTRDSTTVPAGGPAGSVAVKRALVDTFNSQDVGGGCDAPFYAGNSFNWTPSPAVAAVTVDRLWTRFYFYFDAAVNGPFKFHQLFSASYSDQFAGIQCHSGFLGCIIGPEYAGGGIVDHIRAMSDLVGSWHSLEMDMYRNGDTGGDFITTGNGEPSTAIWLDGVPVTSFVSGAPTSPQYWKNGRLYQRVRSSSAKIGVAHWLGVLNGRLSGGLYNTAVGSVWIDRVAVSKVGRIGP